MLFQLFSSFSVNDTPIFVTHIYMLFRFPFKKLPTETIFGIKEDDIELKIKQMSKR